MSKNKIKGRISGLSGWEGRLQDVYESSFEGFKACCEIYSNHEMLGYDTTEEAWEDNPIIQGTVDPRDYTNVSRNHNHYEISMG